MDNSVKQYCRLCLCTKSNENFEKISDLIMGNLDFLLLKLDVDQNKHEICKVCAEKVMEASKFKSKCLCTDNTIISHVDGESGSSVDLTEIYAEENGRELPTYDLYGHKVCRLCMQLINGNFMSVHEVEVEAMEKYIPEINLNITIKDPVVCQQCFDSIGTHSSFLKNCLEVEEKINGFYDSKGSLRLSEILPSVLCVKVEDGNVNQGKTENEEECLKSKFSLKTLNTKVGDIIIKQEDSEDGNECMENKFNINVLEKDEYEIKTEYTDLKSEEDNESETTPRRTSTLKTISKTEMYNCDLETISKSELEDYTTALHGNIPLDPEENSKVEHVLPKEELFKCDKCGFKSTYKNSLKRHRFRCPSLLQMYGCDKCHFKTRHKEDIKIHQMKHTNPSVEEMYQCDQCSYATKYMKSLKVHQLRHKDPSQVTMYKCDKCDFETKHKANVKVHQSRHINSSREEMYPCDQCSYVGICWVNLRDHQLIHKEPSRVYQCKECGFNTRYRASFRRHQFRRHNDLLQAGPTYKCEKCDYATKIKDDMKKHQLKHSNPSKEEMHQCDKCSYETKYKSNFNQHQLKHKDSADVQMYNCDKCSYETKHKASLTRHQLVHEDVTYKCDKCNFETKHKGYIKKHSCSNENKNKGNSTDVQMYSCDECSYETKDKSRLKRHQLVHKNVMYNCDNCNFKTRYKWSIKKHRQLCSKGPSEQETL